MSEHINLTGVVGTVPKHVRTTDGLAVTSFRLASTVRRYDRAGNRWVDGDTNWFTVTAFRQLAVNVLESVDRGQPVMVTGRVRIKDWENGEKRGTSVEVMADSVGHDLSWGRASFERVKISSPSGGSASGPPAPGGVPGSSDDESRSVAAAPTRDAAGWAVPGPGSAMSGSAASGPDDPGPEPGADAALEAGAGDSGAGIPDGEVFGAGRGAEDATPF